MQPKLYETVLCEFVPFDLSFLVSDDPVMHCRVFLFIYNNYLMSCCVVIYVSCLIKREILLGHTWCVRCEIRLSELMTSLQLDSFWAGPRQHYTTNIKTLSKRGRLENENSGTELRRLIKRVWSSNFSVSPLVSTKPVPWLSTTTGELEPILVPTSLQTIPSSDPPIGSKTISLNKLSSPSLLNIDHNPLVIRMPWT